MNDTFEWLAGADRFAPPRQQTLRTTLDWSYHLLQEPEQLLFQRLAVFNGGFCLEAAQSICAAGDMDAAAFLSLLSRLVDKSFVERIHEAGGGSRFRLLEVVRQYGLGKLNQSGEEQTVRDRHLNWYLAFARLIGTRVMSTERGFWVQQIEQELPNLRQAFTWSLADRALPALAHQMATHSWQFWQMRGYLREGLDWLRTALARREGVSRHMLAMSLSKAGILAQHLWDFTGALGFMEEALALWQETGDRRGEAWEIGSIGWVYERMGNYLQAQKMAEDSLAIYAEIGDDYFGMGAMETLAGDLAYIRGDFAEAARHTEASLVDNLKAVNLIGTPRRLTRLAQIGNAQGNTSQARLYLSQSIQETSGSGDRWNTAMILVTAVDLERAQGDLIQAARCLGAAQAFLEIFGSNLWPVDRIIYEKNLEFIQSCLRELDFYAALAEGRQLGSDMDRALAFTAAVLESPGPPEAVPGENGRVVPNGRLMASPNAGLRLTKRERQVAGLIAQGKSNNEIAAGLFIGVRTIETHITNIFSKLGYTSRTQVAVWAAGMGRETPG